MRRYTMKTIHFVLAAVLLSLSGMATAKGPPEKDQLVITPPLVTTKYFQVIFSNNTAEQLDVTFEFFDVDGDPVSNPATLNVEAGAINWIAYDVILLTTSDMSYAHVSWTGYADDVKITVCATDSLLNNATFKQCLRAN